MKKILKGEKFKKDATRNNERKLLLGNELRGTLPPKTVGIFE